MSAQQLNMNITHMPDVHPITFVAVHRHQGFIYIRCMVGNNTYQLKKSWPFTKEEEAFYTAMKISSKGTVDLTHWKKQVPVNKRTTVKK